MNASIDFQSFSVPGSLSNARTVRRPYPTPTETAQAKPKDYRLWGAKKEIQIPSRNTCRLKKTELINYAPTFIEKLFKCPSTPPSTSQVSLEDFLTNILTRTRISSSTLVTAFLYLDRLKRLHPKCKGSPGSGYRLLLSAIMLAAKFMYDDTFDNTAWATVSCGMFELLQVNHMERELLLFLDFKLFISAEEWNAFYCAVEKRIMSNLD